MLFFDTIPDFKRLGKKGDETQKIKLSGRKYFAVGTAKNGEVLFLSKSRIEKIIKFFPSHAEIGIVEKKLWIMWGTCRYKINLLTHGDFKRGYVNDIKISRLG